MTKHIFASRGVKIQHGQRGNKKQKRKKKDNSPKRHLPSLSPKKHSWRGRTRTINERTFYNIWASKYVARLYAWHKIHRGSKSLFNVWSGPAVSSSRALLHFSFILLPSESAWALTRDIQYHRQTDRHTDIQTYRQTGPSITYRIYITLFFPPSAIQNAVFTLFFRTRPNSSQY